jgi:beta-galactosidase beta subunit
MLVLGEAKGTKAANLSVGQTNVFAMCSKVALMHVTNAKSHDAQACTHARYIDTYYSTKHQETTCSYNRRIEKQHAPFRKSTPAREISKLCIASRSAVSEVDLANPDIAPSCS